MRRSQVTEILTHLKRSEHSLRPRSLIGGLVPIPPGDEDDTRSVETRTFQCTDCRVRTMHTIISTGDVPDSSQCLSCGRFVDLSAQRK